MSTSGSRHTPSLAERCAADLERTIFAGRFRPGAHLDEVALAESLNVSRNTLREAFRLLSHQGLVEHKPFRGVFVSVVPPEASHDLYAVRRQLELGALDEIIAARVSSAAPGNPPRERTLPDLEVLARMQDSNRSAMQALEIGDFDAVGTANNVFHLGIVELAGNRIATELMMHVVTQMRLWFMGLGLMREVHERWVRQNEEITELILAGQYVRARVALELYLIQAEERMGLLLQEVLNNL